VPKVDVMSVEDISQIRTKICNNIIIDKKTGCWNWNKSLRKLGYGNLHISKDEASAIGISATNVPFYDRNYSAHRISYIVFKGSINPELEIDHLCRNRKCVNPEHLEQVTHYENCLRGNTGSYNKNKTNCPQGHEYKGNSYFYRNGRKRVCKICVKAWSARYYRRKKMEVKLHS